jgi:hypothetical protein
VQSLVTRLGHHSLSQPIAQRCHAELQRFGFARNAAYDLSGLPIRNSHTGFRYLYRAQREIRQRYTGGDIRSALNSRGDRGARWMLGDESNVHSASAYRWRRHPGGHRTYIAGGEHAGAAGFRAGKEHDPEETRAPDASGQPAAKDREYKALIIKKDLLPQPLRTRSGADENDHRPGIIGSLLAGPNVLDGNPF